MGRKRNENLQYFSLDVNFLNDRAIKKLRVNNGCEGVLIYLYILSEAYKDKGYYLITDDDFVSDVAYEFHVEDYKVQEVLDYLIKRKMIVQIDGTDGTKIITSDKIQMQYQEVFKNYKREILVDNNIWILSEEDTEDCIVFSENQQEKNKSRENEDKSRENTNKSRENDDKSGFIQINPEKMPQKEIKEKEKKKKEIKEKEIKGNKKVNIVSAERAEPFFTDNDIDLAFRDLLRQRKDIGIKNTELAVKKLINKLSEYPKEVILESIDATIERGWRGVFPESVKKTNTSNNPFAEVAGFTDNPFEQFMR